jgi:hypothetical protein
MSIKKEISLFKESPDSWQMKFQEKVGLPFPFPWILVGLIIFGIGYAIIINFGEDTQTIRPIAILCVLIAVIANAVVFFERLLDEVADNYHELLDGETDETKKWIDGWYDNIFWSKKNLICGFLLAVLCVLFGAQSTASLFSTLPGILYSYLTSFFTGFLSGSMLWTMIGFARLTSSLGRDVKIKPSIFDSETSALRTASSVMWKVSVTASMVYLLGISIYYFCSLELNVAMMFILLGFGIFIVLYFIIPQMNIHKILMKLKRGKLKSLIFQIDKVFDKVAIDPSQENINQLRELFQLQTVLNGKSVWSFGTKELLILLGSVLVPLIVFLLDHYARA